MPLSNVIWVAEQEYKAYSWLNRKAPHGKFSEMPKSHQAFLTGAFMLNAGLLGTGVVLPYAALARYSGMAAEFTTAFEAGEYATYSMTARSPHFLKRRVVFRVSMKYAARYAAVKIGSRFLGPIGVALLMYDAWTLGKWIGRKTNPFD